MLPFSSEVTFLLALSSGMSTFHAMLSASSGNILAIIFNYFLGYLLYEKTKTKFLASRVGLLCLGYGQKYGYVAMILSFLPIIGDPLTLVAGVLRLRFVWFVLIVATLRVARYYALMLII